MKIANTQFYSLEVYQEYLYLDNVLLLNDQKVPQIFSIHCDQKVSAYNQMQDSSFEVHLKVPFNCIVERDLKTIQNYLYKHNCHSICSWISFGIRIYSQDVNREGFSFL